MTTTLRSTVTASLGWTWRDQLGQSVVVDSSQLRQKQDLADGDGPLEADAVWHAEGLVLASGQSIVLALDALEQTLFGDVITIPLDRVKALLVANRNEAGEGYLIVGGAAADPWAEPFGTADDTVRVLPQSPLLLANLRDGWDVTPGSTDLEITAAGGEVTFDVAILGTLAGGGSGSSSGS